MIMNVRFRPGQTNRLRIGDEMDLVAPASKLQPEFGGDHSAAAIRWITSDANLHGSPDASQTIPSLDSPGGLGMPGVESYRGRGPEEKCFTLTRSGIRGVQWQRFFGSDPPLPLSRKRDSTWNALH